MNSKKRLRFILSSVLAFVLAVLLTCLTYIGDLYFKGLNTGVLTSAVLKSNYCVELMEAMYIECESITLPIGLPVEVVHDIFDLEDIQKDVSASVKASVEGYEYKADTALIKGKLLRNISAYLTEEKLVLSEEQEVYLEEYVTLIEDEYKNNIEMVVVTRAMPYWNSFLKVAGIASLFITFLVIVIIVTLIKMYHWRHRALRFITYATLAAFIMSVALPAVLYCWHFYERLSISPKYFYLAMIYIIDDFLLFSVKLGCGWGIVSALLLATISTFKKNGYKRSEKKKPIS